MRNRVVVGGAIAMLCAAVLSGCHSATPKHSATSAASSTPSSTPVFASDAEALAAAEKAYGEYLAVFDTVTQNGGANAETLAQVADADALADSKSDADEFKQLGYRTTGSTAVTNYVMEQVEQAPTRVTMYVCEDVSSVDVLNAQGVSQVLSDRRTKQAFEVALTANGTASLKVTARSAWTGAGICE